MAMGMRVSIQLTHARALHHVLSVQVDVFSFGILAYEMLARRQVQYVHGTLEHAWHARA